MEIFKRKIFSWKFIIKLFGHLIFIMNPKIWYYNHLDKKGNTIKRDEFGFKAVKKWAAFVTSRAKMSITVTGLEKVPTDRPVLFISNHQSYADIPLLLHSLSAVDFGFMMKQTLLNVSVIDKISKMIKCVPVPHDNSREAAKAVNKTIEILENGCSMLIFPEGRRGFSNTPDMFKNSAFKIAQKAQVPIVPIYIRNVFNVFEGSNFIVTPTEISVTIFDPIETEGLTRADVRDLHNQVNDILQNEARKYDDYVEKEE